VSAPRTDRAENAVQVGLMLAVGGVAAAASWAHVVELARLHGQPGWLSWADAAVVETLAVSAGLEIRRRRRSGQPVGAVVTVLVAAVALSLAAQVAGAEWSVWGWLMAAVPACGFLVLAKIALGRSPAALVPTVLAEDQPVPVSPVQADEPRRGAPSAAAAGPPIPCPVLAEDRLVLGEDQDGTDEDQGRPYDPGGPLPARNAAALMAAGRAVAADLHAAGTALTRAALVQGLRDRDVRVSTTRASELLRQLRNGAVPRCAPRS
jgi:hypothetical protein